MSGKTFAFTNAWLRPSRSSCPFLFETQSILSAGREIASAKQTSSFVRRHGYHESARKREGSNFFKQKANDIEDSRQKRRSSITPKEQDVFNKLIESFEQSEMNLSSDLLRYKSPRNSKYPHNNQLEDDLFPPPNKSTSSKQFDDAEFNSEKIFSKLRSGESKYEQAYQATYTTHALDPPSILRMFTGPSSDERQKMTTLQFSDDGVSQRRPQAGSEGVGYLFRSDAQAKARVFETASLIMSNISSALAEARMSSSPGPEIQMWNVCEKMIFPLMSLLESDRPLRSHSSLSPSSTSEGQHLSTSASFQTTGDQDSITSQSVQSHSPLKTYTSSIRMGTDIAPNEPKEETFSYKPYDWISDTSNQQPQPLTPASQPPLMSSQSPPPYEPDNLSIHAETSLKPPETSETQDASVSFLHLIPPSVPVLALLTQLYPAALLLAIRLYARYYPTSLFAMALLPRIREVSPTSFVLGATTPFYNMFLALRWDVYSDLRSIDATLAEMRDAGVEVDIETWKLIERIREERKSDMGRRHGVEYGAGIHGSMQDARPRPVEWWQRRESRKWFGVVCGDGPESWRSWVGSKLEQKGISGLLVMREGSVDEASMSPHDNITKETEGGKPSMG